MGRDARGVRWATFDCYGTLVDWNAGIRGELARLFGEEEADRLLARYHQVEPRIQTERPEARYREVMALTLERIADVEPVMPVNQLALDRRLQHADPRTLLRGAGDDRIERLADARPQQQGGWPVFGDVPAALAEARRRGWRLVALSNTDRNFIDASLAAIGVPFEGAIVASEIGSYKPAHGHWHAFAERYSPTPGRHVHVAQSHVHDIAPAYELGIPSVWINRLGEPAEPAATRELPTLAGLADTLDDLVPEP